MPSSRPSSRAGAPRAPLPASVYWRRRLFVLGLAFSLVFVIAQVLTSGSDGSSEQPAVAEQAGAQVSATGSASTEGSSGSGTSGSTGTAGSATTPTAPTTSAEPTLAAPDGPCEPEDVLVTPAVEDPAEGGDDVTITLSLQTATAQACTWRVDRGSVAVKISQGTTEVWTTRECPRAVPSESVVVRRAVATAVELTWNARESTRTCSPRGDWARLGDYTISAAALGGEPTSVAFTLRAPAPRTVEVTPKSSKTAKSPTTPTDKATKKPKRG